MSNDMSEKPTDRRGAGRPDTGAEPETDDRGDPKLRAPERYPAELQYVERKAGETIIRPDPAHPAIRAVTAGRCRGWPKPPTPADVAAAMRSRTATDDHESLVSVILVDASHQELTAALADGSFSMRDVAWWMRKTGLINKKKLHWLNHWTEPE